MFSIHGYHDLTSYPNSKMITLIVHSHKYLTTSFFIFFKEHECFILFYWVINAFCPTNKNVPGKTRDVEKVVKNMETTISESVTVGVNVETVTILDLAVQKKVSHTLGRSHLSVISST